MTFVWCGLVHVSSVSHCFLFAYGEAMDDLQQPKIYNVTECVCSIAL